MFCSKELFAVQSSVKHTFFFHGCEVNRTARDRRFAKIQLLRETIVSRNKSPILTNFQCMNWNEIHRKYS